MLTSDLTLTDPVQIPEGAGTSTSPLIIDFGGKTVNGRIAIVGTNTSRSYVTLKNGYVGYFVGTIDTTLRDDPAQAAVYAKYTDLKLENLDIWSAQLALRISEGTKTLVEGEELYCSGGFISSGYQISIYRTSSEDFVLSNTGGYDAVIEGYIISDYFITLKKNEEDAAYNFHVPNEGMVFIRTNDGDVDISCVGYFPNENGTYKTRRVILHPNYVTTE